MLELADAQQRRCLLTRDRAYRKIWFERSAASRRSPVGKKKGDKCLPCVIPFELRPEKKIDACSHEGDQVAARTQTREQKNLDHMGFLKATKLGTLVPDCEFATKKRIGITWIP